MLGNQEIHDFRKDLLLDMQLLIMYTVIIVQIYVNCIDLHISDG